MNIIIFIFILFSSLAEALPKTARPRWSARTLKLVARLQENKANRLKEHIQRRLLQNDENRKMNLRENRVVPKANCKTYYWKGYRPCIE